MKNNYTLTRLSIFLLYTFLPFFTFLVLTFYFKYLDNFILCDSVTLEELKSLLENDIFKYKETIDEYKYYVNLCNKVINRPERQLELELLIIRQKMNKLSIARNLLTKICNIETEIRKKDTFFRSWLEKSWFDNIN